MAKPRLGERQIGGPRKGAGAEVAPGPRVLGQCVGRRNRAVTGKEKSCRRSWPRHAVRFPQARRLESRDGEAEDRGQV